jgi:hypothetical protein
MNCRQTTARRRAESPFNLGPGSIGDSGPRTRQIERSRRPRPAPGTNRQYRFQCEWHDCDFQNHTNKAVM